MSQYAVENHAGNRNFRHPRNFNVINCIMSGFGLPAVNNLNSILSIRLSGRKKILAIFAILAYTLSTLPTRNRV